MGTETSPKKLRTMERERQGWALRLRGASFQQIAVQLGISRPGAYKLCRRALVRLRREATADAAEFVLTESARLDALQIQAENILSRAETQDAVKLGAIKTLIALSERRTRLHGFDQVGGVNVAVGVQVNNDARPSEQDVRREWMRGVCEVATVDELLVLEAVADRAMRKRAAEIGCVIPPEYPALPAPGQMTGEARDVILMEELAGK